MSVLEQLGLTAIRPRSSVRARSNKINQPPTTKTVGTVGMLEDDFRQRPVPLFRDMPVFTPTAGRGGRPSVAFSQQPFTVPEAPPIDEPQRPAGFAGLLGSIDGGTAAGLGAAGASLLKSTGYSAVPRTTSQVLGEAFEAFGKASREQKQIDLSNAIALAKAGKGSAYSEKMKDLGFDLTTPEGRKEAREFELNKGKIELGEKAQSQYAVKRMEKFADEAQKSQALVPAYDFIIRTLQDPDIDTGLIQQGLLPIMKGLASAGFLTQEEARNVSTLEALQAKMLEIVPQMRPEGSGSTSNFEFANYIKASPSLSKTKEGNLIIAAVAKQSAERKKLEHDMREAYFEETGKLIKSDELAKRMDEKHGSLFKTPFGSVSALKNKSIEEIDAEMDIMIQDGKIKAGDVVYVGDAIDRDNEIKVTVNGYLIISQAAIDAAMGGQ